jgi:putative ABC transport system ATP-binding protein
MPDLIIQMDNVSKCFAMEDLETRALNQVNLEVRRGEFLSVEGPSGAGKTTLLSLLGLLDLPDEGTYLLAGERVDQLNLRQAARVRNRQIGFVFQSYNLIGQLNVLENVELPLSYRGIARSERRRMAEAALDRVGMGHRARHLPEQLSGGQQQRVAVARAVAGEPVILLADEPTGNLDSKNGDIVMDLLEDLNRGGVTICIVTHNPDYGRRASRRIHLFDGRVVEETVHAVSATSGPSSLQPRLQISAP